MCDYCLTKTRCMTGVVGQSMLLHHYTLGLYTASQFNCGKESGLTILDSNTIKNRKRTILHRRFLIQVIVGWVCDATKTVSHLTFLDGVKVVNFFCCNVNNLRDVLVRMLRYNPHSHLSSMNNGSRYNISQTCHLL